MSAVLEHWEHIIKKRLVENALNLKIKDEELTKQIAQQDVHMLSDLLEYTRSRAWQEGHDAALYNGQSENPYFRAGEGPHWRSNDE